MARDPITEIAERWAAIAAASQRLQERIESDLAADASSGRPWQAGVEGSRDDRGDRAAGG
jgi:hypothetical protein